MRNWKVAYEECLKHLKHTGGELAKIQADVGEYNRTEPLKVRERHSLLSELNAAKVEAETLCMSIYSRKYKTTSPNFGLCDSVAGVISQIDNMVAGVLEENEKLEAENAERVQKKRKRFLEKLKESGVKQYNISPMPGATEEQLLDDAISCISALPQINRNVELERDVKQLRAALTEIGSLEHVMKDRVWDVCEIVRTALAAIKKTK
jgi:hypothetical protein